MSVTPTADDLWPQPLRPARSPAERTLRESLRRRRSAIAENIELQDVQVADWNERHPDEEPIRTEPQLTAIARRIRELEARGE